MSLQVRKLSDEQLKTSLRGFVLQERKLIATVIEHIAEVERRSLYLKWGFSSLFAYLTEELGYSEGAANRRIAAARALRQIPEIKEKIQDGSLKLSQITQVQVSLRAEEQATGKKVSLEEKREIFSEIAGKSLVETHKVLDQKLTTFAPVKDSVQTRYKSDDSVQVTLTLPEELHKRLERIKELYSHIKPGAYLVEIIELMAQDVLKMRDPLMKKTRSSKTLNQKSLTHAKNENHGTIHESNPEPNPETNQVAKHEANREANRETKHDAEQAFSNQNEFISLKTSNKVSGPRVTSNTQLVSSKQPTESTAALAVENAVLDKNTESETLTSTAQAATGDLKKNPFNQLGQTSQRNSIRQTQVAQGIQDSIAPSKPGAVGSSRTYIPANVKRMVFQRANHSCQYISPEGRRCGSRYQLEIDHVKPVFAAGTNQPENLQLLCRQHNSYRYRRGTGWQLMY